MNNTSRNSQPGLTPQSKAARIELDEAVTLHFRGNKAGALKALHQALEHNQALADEPFTANLAQAITGLPPAEALKSVLDADESKELIQIAKKERRATPQLHRDLTSLFILMALFILAIGFFIWASNDDTFDIFNGRFSKADVVSENSTLDGYYYYVSVLTDRAPEGGWPVVVAFHGYGADAGQLAPLAETFNEAGAIFVAPSLGTYEPNPGDGPLQSVSRILAKVGEEHPVQSRGAILLGFSQGGSFAYRFSVYYSNQVAGVVTAGAPELDPILPSRNIPYIFTWGELDELQQFVMPQALTIQNRGYNVRTAIVPGVGHAVSQYAIDQVLLLLREP